MEQFLKIIKEVRITITLLWFHHSVFMLCFDDVPSNIKRILVTITSHGGI